MTRPFKQKWTNFVKRITATHHSTSCVGDRCRPSQTSCTNSGSFYAASFVDESEHTSWSDTMSTISEWSNASIGQQKHPIQRYHPSGITKEKFPTFPNAIGSQDSILESQAFEKNAIKIRSLYDLALDELNCAEDSKGSSYYPGDWVAAREAIDQCQAAFSEILNSTNDLVLQSTLQTTVAPRILELQQKYNALPTCNLT